MRELLAKRLVKLTQAEPDVEIAEGEPAEEAVAPRPAPQSGDATKRFGAGEHLFHEGDQSDEAYLVESGSIAIINENDVDEVVLATVDRSAVIGEIALIDFKPRMASVQMVKDATLFVIPAEVFRARLTDVAEIDRLIPLMLTRYVERLPSHVSHDKLER